VKQTPARRAWRLSIQGKQLNTTPHPNAEPTSDELTKSQAAKYLGIRPDSLLRTAIPHSRRDSASSPYGDRVYKRSDLDAYDAARVARAAARLQSLTQKGTVA
jgi:hypothetical protein